MKAGHFYSSQGPLIHEFAVADGEAHVACSPAPTSRWSVAARASSCQTGRDLTRATLPTEKFAGDWFRLVVTDAAGKLAWSNPVWLVTSSSGDAEAVSPQIARSASPVETNCSAFQPAARAAVDVGRVVVEEQRVRRRRARTSSAWWR